ncbi:GRWD1 protein, partial [Alcedo cyanopectus]|nr:GRWD1 protein [Ceyx cyanopectus]
GAPCLSFDIIRDELGEGREEPPLSVLLFAGTQAPTPRANRLETPRHPPHLSPPLSFSSSSRPSPPRLLVMKMRNLHGFRSRPPGSDSDEEEEEEEEDEEGEGRQPQLLLAMAPHDGGVNRVRVRPRPLPQSPPLPRG